MFPGLPIIFVALHWTLSNLPSGYSQDRKSYGDRFRVRFKLTAPGSQSQGGSLHTPPVKTGCVRTHNRIKRSAGDCNVSTKPNSQLTEQAWF